MGSGWERCFVAGARTDPLSLGAARTGSVNRRPALASPQWGAGSVVIVSSAVENGELLFLLADALTGPLVLALDEEFLEPAGRQELPSDEVSDGGAAEVAGPGVTGIGQRAQDLDDENDNSDRLPRHLAHEEQVDLTVPVQARPGHHESCGDAGCADGGDDPHRGPVPQRGSLQREEGKSAHQHGEQPTAEAGPAHHPEVVPATIQSLELVSEDPDHEAVAQEVAHSGARMKEPRSDGLPQAAPEDEAFGDQAKPGFDWQASPGKHHLQKVGTCERDDDTQRGPAGPEMAEVGRLGSRWRHAGVLERRVLRGPNRGVGRGGTVLGVLLGLLTVAPEASAHPKASSVWGHQIDVLVEREALIVEVTVEVPVLDAASLAQRWLRENPDASQEAFNTAFRAGLHQDLRVESDGEVLAAEVLTPSEVLDSDPRFVVWRVRARCSWPGEEADLVVVHGAWPGEAAVYNASVWVSDGVALEDSSLLVERGDQWVSQDGQWRSDPGLREVELVVRRRTPAAAWRHRAWRWLTTPSADWSDAAGQAEVIAGSRTGLSRLLGGAPDAALRAVGAGLMLGAGAVWVPARLLALCALRGREVTWMVGLAVGLALVLHLLPAALLPSWTLPLAAGCTALWAARAAALDRPVALPVAVIVGAVVITPVASAVATAGARGTAFVAGLSLLGLLVGMGVLAWMTGRVLAGRLSPRLRAAALLVVALLQAWAALS